MGLNLVLDQEWLCVIDIDIVAILSHHCEPSSTALTAALSHDQTHLVIRVNVLIGVMGFFQLVERGVEESGECYMHELGREL